MVIGQDLLDHIVSTIVKRFDPERIVLFGSRARGDHRPDSDFDLFVEMESDQRLPERAVAISAAFGLHPWSMDIIAYTPEEVARMRGRVGALLTTIEREGRVLYERS